MSKNIAMIPGRIGSQRLKAKNLALLNGKPLMSYAIQAALESDCFDAVVVNGDHPIFADVADEYGAKFYLRPNSLGGSEVKSDEVVVDFIRNHRNADIVTWINPTHPLQTAQDVRVAIEFFENGSLDSLITSSEIKLHADFNGLPLNYNPREKFAATQDLDPIKVFSYSIMMWNTQTFMECYEKLGYGVMCGNFGTFPTSGLCSLLVKTPFDLMVAESVLKNMSREVEICYFKDGKW